MADRSPFVELLERIGRGGEHIRIAYEGNGQPFRSWPVPPERIDEAVEAAVERDLNVWFEINSTSHLGEEGRSKTRDITRLAALYVDVDYKDGGMGSLPNARQLIDDISAALGVPPVAIVHTGNGLQPYWPVADGDVNADTSVAVMTTMARFKALVDGFARQLGGAVDSLFDLPRIFRVPGSMNVKPSNPEPLAVTVEFPEGNEPFTLAELNEVFDEWGISATPREFPDAPVSGIEEWEFADHDCEFVGTVRAEILHAEVKARHPWMLAQVARLHGLIRYGCVTEATFEELRRLIDIRHQDLCRSQQPVREPAPNEFLAALRWGTEQATLWSTTKLIDEMRSHTHTDFLAMFTTGVRQAVPVQPTPTEVAAQPAPVISLFSKQPIAPPPTVQHPPIQGALALSPQTQQRLLVTARTDSGNAELFAQAVAGRFIHVPGKGHGWYYWDGVRYAFDEGGRVAEALKDLFTMRYASSTDIEEQKWLLQSLNSGRMSATLKWSESVPQVRVYRHELDANAYELATPGGIVDLRTHTMRQANPLVDRHTKLAGYAPDWSGPPTEWLKILEFAFGWDAELVPYIQRLLGIALIGEQLEQHFPIFRGPGGNGKSLMAHILLGVFGSYGRKLGNRFFVETKQESHPETLAASEGIRFAIGSEVAQHAKFNEQLVKELTGDTTIEARKLYEDSRQIRNQTSYWLITNHMPGVTTGGTAWWRRMRNIEMPFRFPEELADEHLKDRVLAEEGGKILAWMIDGTAQYLAHGEQIPASVRRQVAKYRSEEDTMARYVETRLVADDDFMVTRAAVYQDYQLWANMNRIFPVLSEPKFARELVSMYPKAEVAGLEDQFRGFRLPGYVHQPETPYDPYTAVLTQLGR